MIKIEHKKCKGCKWNKYPVCIGIIMSTGNFMNIENLRSIFQCGQKERDIVDDLTPKKSVLELKLESLENRLIELEKK